MSKLRFFVLIWVLAIGLSACATSTLQRVAGRGDLIVGTTGNMPPLNMTTKDGQIIGYEIDLARLIAGALGVKLKLAPMPFSELLPALEAGEVDMVISGMTITPERNMRFAFVGPYFISGKSVLTKKAVIQSAADAGRLNRPDTSLAVLENSTSERFVMDFLPRATRVAVKSYDDGVAMVLDDEVEALVADYPICIVSVFRYPDRGLTSLVTPVTYEPLGIAIPAGDPLMVNWLENFLRTFEGGGGIEALKNRWFKDPSWLSRLP